MCDWFWLCENPAEDRAHHPAFQDGVPVCRDCADRFDLDLFNETAYDFKIKDEGTIVVLTPLNDYARSWIEDRLYLPDGGAPTWWGGGVVVDHRCFNEIAQGLIDEDYRVSVQ